MDSCSLQEAYGLSCWLIEAALGVHSSCAFWVKSYNSCRRDDNSRNIDITVTDAAGYQHVGRLIGCICNFDHASLCQQSVL